MYLLYFCKLQHLRFIVSKSQQLSLNSQSTYHGWWLPPHSQITKVSDDFTVLLARQSHEWQRESTSRIKMHLLKSILNVDLIQRTWEAFLPFFYFTVHSREVWFAVRHKAKVTATCYLLCVGVGVCSMSLRIKLKKQHSL